MALDFWVRGGEIETSLYILWEVEKCDDWFLSRTVISGDEFSLALEELTYEQVFFIRNRVWEMLKCSTCSEVSSLLESYKGSCLQYLTSNA